MGTVLYVAIDQDGLHLLQQPDMKQKSTKVSYVQYRLENVKGGTAETFTTTGLECKFNY